MNQSQVLDISWGTILKVTFTVIVFYILYLISDILIWFLFAIIISVIFDPAINFLQRLRISRFASTAFVYLVFFGIFATSLYLIAPLFAKEIRQFTTVFPQYFEKIAPPLKGLGIKAFESLDNFVIIFQGWLNKASASIFSAVIAIFGGVFSTLTVFSLAFFLSLEKEAIEKLILLLSPKKYETSILELWQNSKNKVVAWFGVRIFACLFVGIMVFLTCYFFNIKYAASFGFLAGILDLIPILGPFIAGAIIVIFATLESWLKALFVLIVFVLIQQIEGNILIPLLSKKFMGLSPFIILISLFIGGKLFGVLGAVFAIPLTGIIFEFSKGFLEKIKKERENLLYE